MMQAHTVLFEGKTLDIVYFSDDCTSKEVKRSLINHDGYDSRIEVRKYQAGDSDQVLPPSKTRKLRGQQKGA